MAGPLGLDDLWGPVQPRPFYDPIIIRCISNVWAIYRFWGYYLQEFLWTLPFCLLGQLAKCNILSVILATHKKPSQGQRCGSLASRLVFQLFREKWAGDRLFIWPAGQNFDEVRNADKKRRTCKTSSQSNRKIDFVYQSVNLTMADEEKCTERLEQIPFFSW